MIRAAEAANRRAAGRRPTRVAVQPRTLVLLLAALLLAPSGIGAAGCDRPAPPPATRPASGPQTTLERLMLLRATRDYDGMREWIIHERGEQMVRTLRAIDEFLVVNEELCRHIRDEVTLGLAQSLDQSAIADQLEVFSRNVELLNETINGDQAVVSYQIDRRLPVRQAELRREGERWLYDPGPGYREELPAAFDALTDGLRGVLADLKSGRWTTAELRERPEALLEAARDRLAPGIEMLPRPAAAPTPP